MRSKAMPQIIRPTLAAGAAARYVHSMSETLLLGVDGSPSSDKALDLVASYRGPAGALSVALVNAQERPALVGPDVPLDLQAVEVALREAGQAITARAIERLRPSALPTDATVRLGNPAQAIVAESEARSAGLVVLGTRGHGALQGFAIGSVALRVAHVSRAPVWLVRPECSLPKAFGRSLRVLLAVDGTAPSLRAARRLVAWRAWLGELDVQVAFVQQPLTFLQKVLPPHDDVLQEWSTRGAETATEPARRVLSKAGIAQHLHITYGDPAEEIAHLAAHAGAELIALGTRGLGATHHALIGSVALKSAVKSNVPVMLVR
jgi:nucleotide-binding universal stress UspA family protein